MKKTTILIATAALAALVAGCGHDESEAPCFRHYT